MTASKMLGVHFSWAENSETHVDHIVGKGLDWVKNLRGKPVLHSNAWMSFYFQLFPVISWGLVTMHVYETCEAGKEVAEGVCKGTAIFWGE